jgi:large subunit ribosomal protein L24
MARQGAGAKSRKKKISHNPRKIHVRRGDKVKVIRGNHAGQEGTIVRVLPDVNRVVIEGINVRKHHKRPTQDNPDGGIASYEEPIHASNVMLLDSSGDPTRIRKHIDNDGNKERIGVRNGNPIPRPKI